MKTQTAGNKGLKLEDINIGTIYTLTINPASQPNRWLKKDICIWYRKVYSELNEYKLDLSIRLWMESSPTGRLHFHGTIQIHNLLTYIRFLNDLAVWAHYEIDTMSPCVNDCYTYDCVTKHSEKCGAEIWHNYCIKQYKIMSKIFDSIIGYPMEINIKSPNITETKITEKRGRTKAKQGTPPLKGLMLTMGVKEEED